MLLLHMTGLLQDARAGDVVTVFFQARRDSAMGAPLAAPSQTVLHGLSESASSSDTQLTAGSSGAVSRDAGTGGSYYAPPSMRQLSCSEPRSADASATQLMPPSFSHARRPKGLQCSRPCSERRPSLSISC